MLYKDFMEEFPDEVVLYIYRTPVVDIDDLTGNDKIKEINNILKILQNVNPIKWRIRLCIEQNRGSIFYF